MSQFFTSDGQHIGVSASASVLPMNTQDWFPLVWTGWIFLRVLKSLLQHHSSKASILRHSAFFIVQLSHPYMTTGKTIALTRRTFVGKVMSLLFNMLSRLLITFLSRKVMFSWKKKCFGINIYVSKNVLELTFIAVYWEDFHSFDPRAFLHLAFSKHLLRQELFKASESSSSVQFSSVTQLCPTLWPHESQHARPPCPSPTPGVHSNSCPSSRWHSHPLSSPSPPAPKASSIRVFSKEPTLRMRWPKYWSFSFSISPSKEHAGLISFRMNCLDLLAVQGTLKSLLQHHSSKASILKFLIFLLYLLSSFSYLLRYD